MRDRLECIRERTCLFPDHGRQAFEGFEQKAATIASTMPAQASKVTPHRFEPAGQNGGPSDERGRLIARTKGGLNTKLHAVTDAEGVPLSVLHDGGSR